MSRRWHDRRAHRSRCPNREPSTAPPIVGEVKHLLATAAAALLLAACDTYPSADPYGAPLPPQDPYGAPLPPQDPYGAYPPPGSYPPTAPESCPIASSREWRASANRAIDRPMLELSGTVVAPTAGYRMEFFPYLQQSRSGDPSQRIARLLPVPPGQPAAQALTTHDVRWQWPLQSGPIRSVTVVCGDRTLADVPVAGF